MVLIPNDIGIRMRMQTEANLLQPVTPITDIPAELPALQTGQRFTARIQEVLPENTYKALVAGKSLTLSLKDSARTGDTLELLVVDRTPKSLVAQLAPPLPELQSGQRFTARIQEVLPENTYKAMVDGKSLTLSLPEGAKIGDTLELVLIDRTPKVLIAQLASKATSTETGQAYPFTSLSRAGQLIGSLLTAEGESPAPAALNRGQPLLAQAPRDATRLAPALASAVKQSGLFYESHQVQWITGRLPLQQLLLEPQGQHADPLTLISHGLEPPSANPPGAEKSALAGRQGEAPTLLEALPGRETKVAAAKTGESSASANRPPVASTNSSPPAMISPDTQKVPEDLRPLVQQQLDAGATQRMAWHGEVWPNQPMELEIEWQERRNSEEGSVDEAGWVTSLRLTTPRLGEVNARLQLSAAGVRLAILTPYGDSAADLREASPALGEALAAAGVPLLGLQVKQSGKEEPA